MTVHRHTAATRTVDHAAKHWRATTLAAACLLVLAGCGGGGSGGGSKTFNVTVTGNTASQTDLEASKGDTITLSFTTDADEEVHLHGYDIHFDCKKGVPLTKTFSAANTGQFEYELEATSQHLGNLVVNP